MLGTQGNIDGTPLCIPCHLLNTWYKRIECLGISLGDPWLSIDNPADLHGFQLASRT